MGCCASADESVINGGSQAQHVSPAAMDPHPVAQQDRAAASCKLRSVHAFDWPRPPQRVHGPNTDHHSPPGARPKSGRRNDLDQTAALAHAPRDHRSSGSTLEGANHGDDEFGVPLAIARSRAQASDGTPTPPRLTADALRQASRTSSIASPKTFVSSPKVFTGSPNDFAGMSARQQRQISRFSSPSLAACRSSATTTVRAGGVSPPPTAVSLWVDDESARFAATGNPLELDDGMPPAENDGLVRPEPHTTARVPMEAPTTESSIQAPRPFSHSVVTEWLTAVSPEA